jgi:Amt family ammonium transporter
VLDSIKTGASSSWILASTALIFFMQLGFVMVEASAAKRQHWSGIVVKNCLDTITGAIAWWVVGFGLAFGPTDSRGFIGLSDNTFSFGAFYGYNSEDLYLKWIFQFAFANTASAIVSGLLMERARIETYGVFSFLMTFFIYPVVACWEWNSTGWLYVKGFHDFAGCGPIHVLGGICGLVGSIIAGTRYNRYNDV